MYIVTGGAGFIGSVFVAKLNAEGRKDIIIVDEIGTSAKWKNIRCKAYLDYIHKDEFIKMLHSGKLPGQRKKGAVKGIVHLGACSSTTEEDFDYLMENNFRYTCALADYALRHNVRFIYASSAATYGDGALGYRDDEAVIPRLKPLNRYGYSKQLFDMRAFENGLFKRIVGLKFFNVYGPNEYHKGSMISVVNRAFQQVREQGQVRLFKSYRPDYADGEQKRDFIYVKDCAEVMWWLLRHPKINGIFNLGTGVARTWNDLARAVFSALGLEPHIKYVDMPEELQLQYQYYTEACMDKLKKTKCPLKFHSLEEGVRDYVLNYLAAPDPYL